MYIAMNRFRVVPGHEERFEEVWRSRERHLSSMPGYLEFRMLKGAKHDDHTLYASHTIWESVEHFTAWTKSEQFRAAHARAGENRGSVQYLSGPHFEGFEVIIHEGRDGKEEKAA
ncbi:antibiotic biosynthesis monooxygenase family protein [Rhizobium sp. SAFR-030]|uniref:antibiotic biosynthesis monooxygenase family protein n=1 Tax=Rhizobium sp. SAFR-030 TaxID=3387277 RepID=UPI003F81F476